MKKRVLWMILTLLALCAVRCLAEGAPAIEWQGHHLTPMHYEVLYNAQYRVRMACDGVPLSLLDAHRDEFELVYPDGATAYTPKRILVLGNSINANSGDGTTDFFDIVFEYDSRDRELFDALTLRVEAGGETYELVRGDAHPERCVFTTSDGAYVVSFYSEEGMAILGERLSDAFNGRDVTVYLDGFIRSGECDRENAAVFLDQFEFGALSLHTSLDVSVWKGSDCLTALSVARGSFLPDCPNVTKLGFTLNRYGSPRFPDFDKLPVLEEMDLLLKASWPGDEADLFEQDSRPVRTCPSLRTMNITAERGSVLSADPDFRVWLAAQRAANPELTINGEDARQLDLTEGMDDSAVAAIAAVEDDGRMFRIYQDSLEREPTEGAIGEKVVALVINKAGTLEAVSTDVGSAGTFDALPAERLAASLAEADTLLIVYPTFAVVGKYSGVIDARSCTTMTAAVDLETGETVCRESVVTRQPPATITLGRDETSGTYEVEMGLAALAARMRGEG